MYAGDVVAYDPRRGMHCVAYDSGERAWQDLSTKQLTCLRPGAGLETKEKLSPAKQTTPLSLSAFVSHKRGLKHSGSGARLPSPFRSRDPHLNAVYGAAAART